METQGLFHDTQTINDLEDEGEISTEDIVTKEALKMDFAARLQREVDWQQKLRARWIKEGNYNMRFFHCTTSHHTRCSFMKGMEIEGRGVKGNEDLRQGVKDYFCRLYCEEFVRHPRLDGINFNMLDEATKEHIERDLTVEEIYEAPKQCKKDKTSGPYGFNMGLLQKFPYLVKDDEMELVKEFHDVGTL